MQQHNNLNLFGLYLEYFCHIDHAILEKALHIQQERCIIFGTLAMEMGILSLKEIMTVISAQAESTLQFGELAIQEGLLSRKNCNLLLAIQRERKPRLGEVLIEMGIFSVQERDQLLADFHRTIAISNTAQAA